MKDRKKELQKERGERSYGTELRKEEEEERGKERRKI